ncbi:MAG: hypothetical protein E7773_13405 [Sphingomonas sp.]|uniref:hypothetical protein n=1 Tax=Sphingomonas sp. TaxID=28214 RepID=UPI001209073B|nr:hypothetical protein [Sphingomonas sp.]THD35423.1 MAG: hypothetical protein E7773_13405 [Sphingomonas sp.]
MPSSPRSFSRWTVDAEIAFVVALKLHGRAHAAAAEIGRTVSGAYHRRKRLPDFAAKWDAAIEDWRRRMGADRAPPAPDRDDLPIVERFDGFTKQRRRAFLRKLTDTGDVEEACAYVRLSVYQARQLRRDHPSFRAAWDRALEQSVATLEQAAIERALHGVEEPVWHAGKIVGTRRRYSDGLLRTMVTRGGPAQRKDPAAPKRQTRQELIAAAQAAARLAGGHFAFGTRQQLCDDAFETLRVKLEKMEAHLKRKAAEKRAADKAKRAAAREAKLAAERAKQEVLPPLADGEEGPAVRVG